MSNQLLCYTSIVIDTVIVRYVMGITNIDTLLTSTINTQIIGIVTHFGLKFVFQPG